VTEDKDRRGTSALRPVLAALRPGLARLGIVRYYVTAGSEPGMVQTKAQLQGSTRYTINVIVDRVELRASTVSDYFRSTSSPTSAPALR
jgi:hypothetical protein